MSKLQYQTVLPVINSPRTSKVNVIIRADASVKIGSGHVMRCLTLAEKLKENGSTVSFICREHEGNLIDLIEKKGFDVKRLPKCTELSIFSNEIDKSKLIYLGCTLEEDAEATKNAVLDIGDIDLIIVDNYAIDERWEREFRYLTKSIMVIDDLADRKHECDYLLDQNFFLEKNRYKKLVPPRCKLMLGPEYALLRNEFTEQLNLQNKKINKTKELLIFFDGSDEENLTKNTLEALQKVNIKNINIDVVVGSSNPHKKEIKKLAAQIKNTKYHIQIDYMAKLMANADLAIGAGGSTTWERCCLGLPSAIITLADNQIETTIAQNEAGLIHYLGHFDKTSVEDISKALNTILTSPVKLQQMSERIKKLVDGKGAEKVISTIINSTP